MSHVLIVKGHPLTKEHSSTLQLLDTFLKEYLKIHPNDTIEVVDVFCENFPSIDEKIALTYHLHDEELSDAQKQQLKVIEQYTNQFINSDKIIIANPLWNHMVPSHLKQWIDTIIQSNKTFAYTKQGKVSYVKDKKILHLQSNGSRFNGEDLATKYLDSVFSFIEIYDIKHIYIDGKDIPGNTNKAIQQGLTAAKAFAKDF